MTRPLTIIDTETTGLHHTRECWDFYALWWSSGDVTQAPDIATGFQLQINVATAQPAALEIGNFFERSIQGACMEGNPTPGDALPQVSIHEAVERIHEVTHGATIAGIVPSFDMHTMENVIASSSAAKIHTGQATPEDLIVPTWHYKPLDVVNFALGALSAAGTRLAPDASTEQVAQALGVDMDRYPRHSARGDVLITLDMYRAALALGARA